MGWVFQRHGKHTGFVGFGRAGLGDEHEDGWVRAWVRAAENHHTMKTSEVGGRVT